MYADMRRWKRDESIPSSLVSFAALLRLYGGIDLNQRVSAQTQGLKFIASAHPALFLPVDADLAALRK